MPETIKILEFITPSTIGGAEVLVADFCLTLSKLGAQVDVFCPLGRPFVNYSASRGLKCFSWKTSGKIDPITVLRLSQFIRNNQIHLVHTHLSTASILGSLAARLAHVPSVAHVHGLNNANCFRYSTRVIAVSKAVKEHLCAQGIPAHKVTVVYNGVDLSKFDPVPSTMAKQQLGYDISKPLIGVFGRLSAEKGQISAIRAMPLILSKHPGAILLLAGRGRDEERLKSAATDMGIADKVLFPGFTQDIRQFMSACDIVLTPSNKEGFGISAIEAMALERPVIASSVGGLIEIVEDGETGFIVSPQKPEEIAAKVIELLDDRHLSLQMGIKGRKRVESHFDLNKQTALLLSVMRNEIHR